ncbi:MAG TPA: hypothetical protein V6D26_32205 [Stenomitos sp.]
MFLDQSGVSLAQWSQLIGNHWDRYVLNDHLLLKREAGNVRKHEPPNFAQLVVSCLRKNPSMPGSSE